MSIGFADQARRFARRGFRLRLGFERVGFNCAASAAKSMALCFPWGCADSRKSPSQCAKPNREGDYGPGLTGLTGSSFLLRTQIVPPMMSPPPTPMAIGELRIPPDAPGAVPAPGFLRFFLLVCV